MSPSPARTAVAHRYRCSADTSVLCDQGDGTPTQKVCRHCRGALVVETGQWGAFEWSAANAYLLEAAVRTFASRPFADRCAEANNLVVRFIADEPAPRRRPEITLLRGGRS
jgi:hypothetical protein